MNRDHLVPESIVDKNGKSTTTYKNPATTAAATAQSLPVPSAYAPETKTPYEIVTELVNQMDFYEDGQYIVAQETMDNYPEEMLHKLVDVADQGIMWESIQTLIGEGESAAVINESILFFPHLRTEVLSAARDMVKSLHSYPQLPETDDYTKSDERTQQQCRAILTVTELLEEANFYQDTIHLNIMETPDSRKQRYLKSETTDAVEERELIDMLMDHPELAQRIGAILVERATKNIDLIKEIINSETPALADGTL